MTTALSIITSASEKIGYKAAEVPMEAADIQIGLEELNDMLAEWNETGIKLGASPVELPADTVRIPRGAVAAVKLNLAGRLAVPFTRPITPELAAAISASTQSLLRMVVKPIDVQFPSTMPSGSGNSCDPFDDDTFLGEDQKVNF